MKTGNKLAHVIKIENAIRSYQCVKSSEVFGVIPERPPNTALEKSPDSSSMNSRTWTCECDMSSCELVCGLYIKKQHFHLLVREMHQTETLSWFVEFEMNQNFGPVKILFPGNRIGVACLTGN